MKNILTFVIFLFPLVVFAQEDRWGPLFEQLNCNSFPNNITPNQYAEYVRSGVLNDVLCAYKQKNTVREIYDSNNKGLSLLHIAVANNLFSIADFLIAKGANVNDKNNPEQKAPIHFVREINSLQSLIKAGADINAVDRDGNSLLHLIASEEGDDRLKLVQFLINVLKANPQIKNAYGDTPLHLAISKEKMDMISALISSNKVNLNIANNKGESPIHIAVAKGNMDIFNALLEAGVDVGVVNAIGMSPLDVAVSNNNNIMFDALLELYQNVNFKNKTGNTVFSNFILYEGYKTASGIDFLNKLINKGADLNAEVKGMGILIGKTSLHVLSDRYQNENDENKKKILEVVKILIAKGANNKIKLSVLTPCDSVIYKNISELIDAMKCKTY